MTKGMPVAWNHRFAGSSVIARWLPPAFKNGLDPDTTEGAIDLVYALPNMHVEYVRVEPPGIPTAFWRSVGPSHNVFVTESFIDELAAAAKQDPVAYRRALLDKSPRAKAVLELAAEKAGWGQPLPARVGRGVALQFVFGSYMAQVAEVEVAKDGAVRVRRVVCAVDCGTVVNPDTVRAQIQSAVIFGITAALYGEITLKDGRVEQSNFDTYQMLRINEAPAIEVHIVAELRAAGRHGRGRDLGHRSRGRQRDLRRDRQAPAQDAGRPRGVEAGGVTDIEHSDTAVATCLSWRGSMRSDMVQGAVFPDYELVRPHRKAPQALRAAGTEPDGARAQPRWLLSEGSPAGRRARRSSIARWRSPTRRLVTISTDNITETNENRSGIGAHWPFLSDTRRIVQKDLDIAEYTDPAHNPMIPHTIVLEPGLVIYKIYNGYWFWGRPTVEDLRQDLRAVSRKCRPDWDIATPELKAAWQRGPQGSLLPLRKNLRANHRGAGMTTSPSALKGEHCDGSTSSTR